MPRVAPSRPEEDENSNYSRHQPHHHTPNTRHYRDVSGNQHDRQMLVNFEQYTARDEDDDEPMQIPKRSNEYGGPENRSGRNPDPRGRGDTSQPPMYPPGGGGAPPPPAPPPGGPVTPPSPESSKAGKFMQWDVLSFVILLAYLLCIAITVLAIWCYRQDTAWNTIVRNEGPFPNINNEDFFSGKHLYIYQRDEGLRHAKQYLLRENRWLELMHIMFMSAFLILTLFQLAAYVTRGDEDHSKLILCYYIVFGGLGLIVSLFPLLSWHTQETNYKGAVHYLRDFARRIEAADPSLYTPGNTLATANDARTLAHIMQFCYDVSQSGVTLEDDTRYIEILKRYYRLPQLQHLGFCTHHKFKIVNTVLSTIFALICCAIPCIYCFQAGEEEDFEKPPVVQQPMFGAPPPPPPPQYQREPEEDEDMEKGERRERKRKPKEHKRRASRGHYTRPGGEPLTEREINEIEKWKRYVQAEDDDD